MDDDLEIDLFVREKQAVINRLEARLQDPWEDDVSKNNTLSFFTLLRDGALDDHKGRCVALVDGHVWPNSFESAREIVNFEPLRNYEVVIRHVPGGSSAVGTAHHSSVISPESEGSSLNIPVKYHVSPRSTDQTNCTPYVYEIDSGASDTSCPLILSKNPPRILDRTVPDKKNIVKYTLQWKVLAFWGERHVATYKEEDVKLHIADGSTILVDRLWFKDDQLHMEVGTCEAISVLSLVLPKFHKEDKSYPMNVGDDAVINRSKPTFQQPMLLGRDILFRYFSVYFTKEVGKPSKVHLFNRPEITPPASPRSSETNETNSGWVPSIVASNPFANWMKKPNTA